MSNSKPPVVWLPVTVFTVTTLVTLIAVPWYGLTVGYSASAWIAAVVVLFLNGISITAGYHRLWSHNAYKASLPVRVLFALFGAAATQNSIKVWASGHRRHHRHVDDNEKDPYSAGRGFWFSHIGWMCRAYPSGKVSFDNIKDLERDPVVEWQHKYYVPLALIMNFLPALTVGLIVGDIWSGILLAGFLRLVVSHHSTFFINSLAHIWGRRPYTHENSARDNDVLALFTYGEGYHNYHHIFQGDYRNGIRWWHYDPTKWLIWTMSKLGLANDLKRTEKAHIDAAIIATRLLE
jgi:stearoyl-CoA desaturase (delta-9 desaturase)